MATIQSERGRIELFEDFLGTEAPILNETATAPASATGALWNFGKFVVRGNNIEAATCGIVPTGGRLNGVARFTSPSSSGGDAIFLGTETNIRVDKMATIVIEARLELILLTNRRIFVGLCGNFTDTQNDILTGSSGLLTLSAEDDLCGFFFDSALEATKWYMPFNGGSTTGETDASEVVSSVTPIAEEFDIVRLEVDNNGTARWFINGALEQTVSGAISTSEVFSAMVGAIYNSSAAATLDIDYFSVKVYRDWTV